MPDSSIGKVQLDLETNSKPFEQQLQGISGKATGMVTNAFKGLGKFVAGAFAVKTLVDFGKASINLASDLAEVQNVVDVVFGDANQQINNFAKNALTQYGLSELSAKQYASTMGAMLKSMGLSQKATVDMSQAITGLTGDMASFYNLDSDTAFQKIRAGISGETEPLKQLGINMSVANMEAFALEQGITKSYQKMSQSEQALLRYNYLLKTTADAQGDFVRTSDSWANQTRILSEQFNSLKATLGSAFIALLTPVVRVINTIISRLQVAANYFKAFVEAITGVKSETNSASSGMTDIADSAIEAGEATEEAAKKASNSVAGFDKLHVLSSSGGDSSGSSGSSGMSISNMDIPALADVKMPEPDTSGIEKAVNKAKGLFGSLKTYVSTSFAPSIKAWGKAFTDLKAPAKSAFSSVSTSVSNLWENTLKPFGGYVLEDFIPSIVNSFSETYAPIFTDVMSVAMEEFAKDAEFACQAVDTYIKDIYQPALEQMKTITTDANESIKTEWAKSGSTILTKFQQFRDSIKDILTMLYNNIIKPVVESIQDTISWLWDKHLKKLWDNIVQFTSKLIECVLTIWDNCLSPLVQWIVGFLGPKISTVVNFIIGIVGTVVGVISDVIGGILKALGGLLDFITGIFSGNWKKAWEGLKNFFKGIWDGIWGIVKGVINLIVDALNLIWGAIYTAVSGIINGLGGIAGAIGKLLGKDWKFSMPAKPPYIPKLAKGGIIDQPTLAMVGEKGKEAVVPLENTAFADSIANAILRVLTPILSKTKAIGGTDGTPQIIVFKVGEYELGRITVGAINRYHNVIGKVELEV